MEYLLPPFPIVVVFIPIYALLILRTTEELIKVIWFQLMMKRLAIIFYIPMILYLLVQEEVQGGITSMMAVMANLCMQAFLLNSVLIPQK